MKFIVFFLIVNVNFTICFSQIKGLNFPSRFNKIEVIKTNLILYDSIFVYNFDKKGRIDSTLRVVIKFDSLGNIIEERFPKTKNNVENFSRNVISYNENGKILKRIKFSKYSNPYYVDEYSYDSLKNEIFFYEYNADTTTLTIQKKIYNSLNQIIQLETKINNNPEYVSRKYFYENNDLIIEKAYDVKGKIIFSYLYEIHKSLNTKKTSIQNLEGTQIENIIYFNSKGLPIKEKFYFRGVNLYNGKYSDDGELNVDVENMYNTNDLIEQSSFFYKGKKIELHKHYYKTFNFKIN